MAYNLLELSDDKAIDDDQFEKYSEDTQPVHRVNYSNLMSHLASGSNSPVNMADQMSGG